MKRNKIIFLLLAILCFSVAGFKIYKNDKKKQYSINDYEFYDECTLEQTEETIQKDDKIGPNTDITIKTLYTKCNHEVDEYIDVDANYINKTYDDIINMYPNMDVIEFSNKHVILKDVKETYCPYHYIVKENNNMIVVYRQITDDDIKECERLDISIDNLRQNDKYMFQNGGIKIYGRQNLYQFIEDFDS